MFFNREKISIKKDKNKYGLKYYIDFNKLENKKDFKMRLIRDIFKDDLILGVVDTSLMYSDKTDNEKLCKSLKELCVKYSIEYKVIKTKKEDKGMFGSKIKIGEGAKGFDYIFGIALDSKKADYLGDVFNEYNGGFFTAEKDNILEGFDLDYQDMNCNLYVFIDNFMNRAAVSSKKAKDLETVLERIRKDFK